MNTNLGEIKIEPHLLAWLRRANAHPEADKLLLSGSVLLALSCKQSRIPVDVDYLVLGEFDATETDILARAIAQISDRETRMTFVRSEVIYDYTDFPGLRAHYECEDTSGHKRTFKVDFTFNDPLPVPQIQVDIPTVGRTWAVTLETLFAWKLNALVQWRSANWRAKDLYDLDVMWQAVPLDRTVLEVAIPLAFSSRDMDFEEFSETFLQWNWGYWPDDIAKWAELCVQNNLSVRYTDVRFRLFDNLHKLNVDW